MGTNYYAQRPGRDPLHIGKSTYGWHFALHSIPKEDLTSLAAWKCVLPMLKITDEYDCVIPYAEMVAIICERRWKEDPISPLKRTLNDARQGLNGLLACKSSAPTGGTWDMVEGEFS